MRLRSQAKFGSTIGELNRFNSGIYLLCFQSLTRIITHRLRSPNLCRSGGLRQPARFVMQPAKWLPESDKDCAYSRPFVTASFIATWQIVLHDYTPPDVVDNEPCFAVTCSSTGVTAPNQGKPARTATVYL